MGLAALQKFQPSGPFFVPGSCLTPSFVNSVFAHGEVGQDEFGFNDICIPYRIHAPVHMGDVSIFKASDHMQDGVDLPNMG